MRKTTNLSPQAALHPQSKGDTSQRKSGSGTTCITYTLNVPDLIIIATDAADDVATPADLGQMHITMAQPTMSASLMDLIARVLATGHCSSMKLDQPALGDDPVYATCVPIRDAAGTPTQVILTLTGLTDMAPEQPAPVVAGKFMQIIDHLPVGILWLDRHGGVLYANERQRTLTNSLHGAGDIPANQDLPHPHWLKLDTHEPYRWSELPVAQTIASGMSAEALVANSDWGDDDEQVNLIKTEPIFDNAGQMTDIIAVQIDLTAQYHAEQEVMRRAAEQDTLIDGMIDGLIIYDRHGKPTRYNPAMLRILGWDQAGVDPLHLTEAERVAYYDEHLAPGGGVADVTWPSVQALAGELPEPVEAAFRQPDGTRVITYVHAVPLRDPLTNEITGAVTVVRDITQLRQLDYMKDEFMSVASHELRTPLTSLLLASRLMQRWLARDDRGDDLRRLAEDVASQVKRMDRLINNMLDMTRINAQHFALVTRPTNITQMIRETIAEQYAASGRAITYSGVQSAISSEIDAERMRQVLANILSNAIKYDASALPIEVTTTLEPSQSTRGAHILIAVHDHGYGISVDRLPHLFEQATCPPQSEVAGRQHDGMGLSLYICRAIVEQHGGRIWAESAVGMGTTFTIALPASMPQAYYAESPQHLQSEMLQ